MAWASKTFANAREIAQFIQRMATAKYASSVSVSAGGSGYVDGDELTVTHTGAHLDCKFIVGVTAGAVTSIKRIEQNGAFANRVTGVSVTAGNAGTGYAVGDVVQLLGGTFKSPAKFEITGVGGSGDVTTLSVVEGGGHYTANPSNGASTDSSIGTGTGTGLKVDLTFSGLVGGGAQPTTTTGAGTGATVTLTLADGGWTVLKSVNNYLQNSIDDNHEMVLEGTGGTGSENPIVGIRTGSDGAGPDRAFLSISPMTAYDSLSDYDDQLNILNPVPGTTGGQYVQITVGATTPGYLGIGPRYLSGDFKCVGGVTAWHHFFVGLGNPYGTVTESPYPMLVICPSNSIGVDFDSTDQVDIGGITELHRKSTRFGPAYIWSQADLDWVELVHGETAGTGPAFTVVSNRGVTPLFRPRADYKGTANKGRITADAPYSFHDTIGRADGGTATHALKPTPDSGGAKQALLPIDVVHSLDDAGITDGGVDCQLPNYFWVSAKKTDGSLMVAEDAITYGNVKYLVFPSGTRGSLAYAFFARQVGA